MARYQMADGTRETHGKPQSPAAAFGFDSFFSDAVTTEIAAACGIETCRHGKPSDAPCFACIEDELGGEVVSLRRAA